MPYAHGFVVFPDGAVVFVHGCVVGGVVVLDGVRALGFCDVVGAGVGCVLVELLLGGDGLLGVERSSGRFGLALVRLRARLGSRLGLRGRGEAKAECGDHGQGLQGCFHGGSPACPEHGLPHAIGAERLAARGTMPEMGFCCFFGAAPEKCRFGPCALSYHFRRPDLIRGPAGDPKNTADVKLPKDETCSSFFGLHVSKRDPGSSPG